MKTSLSLLWIGLLMGTLFLSSACKTQGTAANNTRSQDDLLADTPAIDMLDLLKRQSFLTITGNGRAAQIQIRGQRSINATNEPLMVVNGIRMGNGYRVISDLNPGDVERIDVIRDAATLSSYGIAGANGVIEIKLKK